MTSGDLTVDLLSVKSKDEIAILARSCNDMVLNLRKTVGSWLRRKASPLRRNKSRSAPRRLPAAAQVSPMPPKR
ncbi:hypothetical protein [Paenibacillus agricola]|uniref:hypothetical protein n=1 Tax=Paenibacillus agricola TaxID=2716264 RepID=UPI0028932919|nr:hypothetical protein [Paenibacillus agricola]